MNDRRRILEAFERGEGILRLVPNFVPRLIGKPGRRLRLHPDDYYAFGTRRGPIAERRFSSTIPAVKEDVPLEEKGMSYVALSDDPRDKVVFRDVVDVLGAQLIGEALREEYGTWPMYAKFFDFQTPLFHHLHLGFAAAERVGALGKPEGYYFPPQLNNHVGDFPVTYFGYAPDVTREQVKERLLAFEVGDNRITELSRAYRLELGTGWYVPPGVVHAPGSLLTYEIQWNSAVVSVHENVACGVAYPYETMVADCPEEKKTDIDYVMSLMDWEKNVDPHFRKHYFRPPIPCAQPDVRYTEKWIMYGNDYVAAKELTIPPGAKATVRDGAAYGCIVIQGHGTFGPYDAEAAIMLRFGQLSGDEYFVSEEAARRGVTVENRSRWEPMVILKHFGPNHPDVPK